MTLNFKDPEFHCKCGRGCKKEVTAFVTRAILQMLHVYLLKAIYGAEKVKIIITSGIRCHYWNRHVNGTLYSRHMVNNGGDAVDFRCFVYKEGRWEQIPPRVIYYILDKLFPDCLGLGWYNGSFNHLDPRDKKARWKG